MKNYKFILLLINIFFFSYCNSPSLITLTKEENSNSYRLIVYQEKKDSNNLIFSITNNSDKVILYPNELFTLGNLLTIYTPSGVKIPSLNSSGRRVAIAPKESFDIKFSQMDYALWKHIRVTETGWYKFIWRVEHLNVATTFEYYFDYEKTKQKYLPQ